MPICKQNPGPIPQTCEVHLCDFVLDLGRGNLLLKSDSEPQFLLEKWGGSNNPFPVIPEEFGGVGEDHRKLGL